jgi:hypothetical protein
LDAFARCFTTPTFDVFQAMVMGLVAQTGNRTVCGMLTGAGLATSWSHHRAHRFFSTARWQIDQIGLTVFDLVLTHLVADGDDLLLAVDDTAHRRRGKKVHGVGWIHDGSTPARNKWVFRLFHGCISIRHSLRGCGWSGLCPEPRPSSEMGWRSARPVTRGAYAEPSPVGKGGGSGLLGRCAAPLSTVENRRAVVDCPTEEIAIPGPSWAASGRWL